ncbi:MAG: S1C family serine protease [Candidatus Kapaibacterium sp.]
MKKILFLVLAVVFVSCKSYEVIVKISNRKPEITNDKPLYVFYDPENEIPDSSEYLGIMDVYFNLVGAYNFGVSKNMGHMILNSMERQVKLSGGNCILLSKPENFEKRGGNVKLFTAKVYRVNDPDTSEYTENNLYSLWQLRDPDEYEGIYETDFFFFDDEIPSLPVRYAIIRKDSINYEMIYLSGLEETKNMLYGFVDLSRTWREGDIFAYLEKTARPSLFKAHYFEFNKYLKENCMFNYNDGNPRLYTKDDFKFFNKVYPDTTNYEMLVSSFTGFAISSDKIVTCYHGFTNEDLEIQIKGHDGRLGKKVKAVLDKYDKEKDIAVLKINNNKYDLPPFSFAPEEKEAAEEIFVLGYPVALIMGEEIKVTKGIISAKSGIGGNLEHYQISAPIQLGNSGSPLFDDNGDITGMVTSGISSADNVGYSLKSRHILEFLEENGYSHGNSESGIYKELSLTDKVKKFQESIFLIELIDKEPPKNK